LSGRKSQGGEENALAAYTVDPAVIDPGFVQRVKRTSLLRRISSRLLPKVGDPAPDFVTVLSDGQVVHFRGQPV
jgi:hypothetical protein